MVRYQFWSVTSKLHLHPRTPKSYHRDRINNSLSTVPNLCVTQFEHLVITRAAAARALAFVEAQVVIFYLHGRTRELHRTTTRSHDIAEAKLDGTIIFVTQKYPCVAAAPRLKASTSSPSDSWTLIIRSPGPCLAAASTSGYTITASMSTRGPLSFSNSTLAHNDQRAGPPAWPKL